MVAQNANIDALLAKLSKAKPLPKATQTFTSPTQQLQSQIRDSVIENVRRAPTLQDSLNAIAQGQQSNSNPALGVAAKVFGNPIVKTALMPVIAFDTGRRGVISGIREAADMLDSDPNTKASFSDFAKQAKDPTYGFGTAFPMSGWQGKLIGFAGDVLLDPLTYATLGSAVPASALLRGATSTGLRVSTRQALGAGARTGVRAKLLGAYKPVRIFSPDARNNLAKVSGDQARRVNLLDDATADSLGLVKRSEADIQVMEQLIAKHGKTRVPQDIARDIGLPEAGIYWFGSRVKMPLSGPLGKGLEFMLAGARTRITGRTTGAVARFMDQITPEGVKSDAVNVKDMRRALITGKVTPEEASTYLRMLDDNRQRRVIENFTKSEYNRKYNLEIANNPLIQAHKNVIHELIENPQRLATATPDEIQAKNLVDNWFSGIADSVQENMRIVDPDFQLNRLPNYFPHQQTEKAMNYVDNLRNPFAEQLRAYLHTDLADPSVAFSHRTLQKGKVFFGHVLTDDDVAKGVKRLNEIARTKGGIDFDFFETDALKALAKYGDSYANEISRAHFLKRQFDNGVLAMLEATGSFDSQAMKALELAVRAGIKDVASGSREVAVNAGKLTGVLRDALDTFVAGARKNVKKGKTLARDRTVAANAAEKNLANVKIAIDALVEGLEKSGLKEARDRFDQFGISGILSDTVVDEPLQKIISQLESISATVRQFNTDLAMGTQSLENFKSELSGLATKAARLEKEAKDFTEKITEFDEIHNVLADFINGKYSDLVMESAEEGGSEALVSAVRAMKSETLRNKVDLTRTGRLKKDIVKNYWGEAGATEEVIVLKQWLDPTNRVSRNALTRLTIDQVREIIARASLSAGNLPDLQKALTWMVIRDIDRSPSLLTSIVKQLKEGATTPTVPGNSLESLIDDSGSITRIATIKDTINKIAKLNEVLTNVARKDSVLGQKGYGGAAVQEIRNNLEEITQEIFQKRLNLADITPSVSNIPLARWKQLAVDNPNQIVVDPEEIADLFLNLRSVADATEQTTIRQKPTIVQQSVLGQELVQTDLDDIAEITISALKQAGIENQARTYAEVQDFLEAFTDRLPALPREITPAMVLAMKEIDELEAVKAGLLKEVDKNALQVQADVRDEFASAMDAREYVETVMDYTNRALEYYVYSETKSQFNNLMDQLAPFGVKPSYGLYQRLLGDIAKTHNVQTQIVKEQLVDAESIMRAVMDKVKLGPASEQGFRLRAALLEALENDADRAVLGAVFPEVEAVVRSAPKLTDMSRRQAIDVGLIGLRKRLASAVRELADEYPTVQAGTKQRAGYLMGDGDDAVPSAGPGDLIATKGQTSKPAQRGRSTPKAGTKQLNIFQLIDQIEGSPTNVKNILNLIEDFRDTFKNRVPARAQLRLEATLEQIAGQAKVRIDEIQKQLDLEKQLRVDAGLPKGRRSAAKVVSMSKQLAKDNYNYGLSGSLTVAVNSASRLKVNAFFAAIFGGQVFDRSNQFTKYTGIINSSTVEKNQAALYKTIDYDVSILGIMNRKLSERRAALFATEDMDYDIAGVAATGSLLPGLTEGASAAKSAYGVKAYAELLRERAAEIQATIMNNEEFAAQILRLRKDLNDQSGIDVETQLMQLIKQEEVVVSGNNVFRVSPQTNISSLPPRLQKSIIEARKLKIEAAQIMQSNEYLAANHEQLLNSILHELAALDGHRLVNKNGVMGWFYEQSGLNPERTWNARRPGTDNALNDDSAVVRWVEGRVQIIDQGTKNVSRRQTLFSGRTGTKNGFPNYGVHRVDEVPFDINNLRFDDSSYVYLIPSDEGFRTIKERDFTQLNDNELGDIVVLKHQTQKGKGEGTFPELASAVRAGQSYDPKKTWIRFNAEPVVMGAQKTASEGMVTRAALPEAWVRSEQIISHQVEDSTFLSNVVFTPDEWETLFVPAPMMEQGKLQNLTALKNKHQKDTTRFAEMSRAKGITSEAKQRALAKMDKSQKAFYVVDKELKLYEARTSARAKLNRLLRSFSDPQAAKLLGIKTKGGKAASPQQVAKAFVSKQIAGRGADDVPIVPQDPSTVIQRQKGIKAHWRGTPHAKVLKQLREVQEDMSDLAFVQYADSLELQYKNYLETLEELRTITNDWTRNQSTVDNAKTLSYILKNPKVRKEVYVSKVPTTKITVAQERQIKKLLTSGEAANEEEALAMIAAHNENLARDAAKITNISEQLDAAPAQAPLEATPDAPQLRAGRAADLAQTQQTLAQTRQLIDILKFEEVLKTQDIKTITQIVNDMTVAERTLLAAKTKRMEELASVDATRLKLINDALRKAKIKSNVKDPVERLILLSQGRDLAVASFDQARHLKDIADTGLENSKIMLDKLEDVAGRAKLFKKPDSKDLDWVPEFEAWRDEAVELIEMLSKNNSVNQKTKNIMTAWIDGVNSLELSKASLSYNEANLAVERGFKEMFEATGVGPTIMIKQLKDGYEYLNKDAMPNVMVKQAFAEILRNANSFRDPLAGATLNRVLKRWNSYWKPLATTTPGFHVRNNLGNIFALVFGGAKISNLREATEVSIKWMQSTKDNIGWDDFVRTLTPEQQQYADTAHWAVAATGGGVYNDVPLSDNFIQRRKTIQFSRKLGYDADSFARFVFSYDAAMQGFSPEQAAMRTKRFYIDYEDVSSFDKTMRQIVPFWMWTSRNVVTQVQNMWTNPKPYLMYNSFVRNFGDKDDDNAVSKSWRDLQAFKLPFGKDLYAMPDLGFTRVQQQMEMAKTPTKFLADVSPLVRLPAELIAGKQFYNGREFKKTPTQVEGVGPASLLQPLAQLLGMGETNAQGQKFINEKLLYAITAGVPPFSIADRMMPSTGANAGGFDTNTLAGFFGSPVKQLTPQMQRNELLRRLFEIQDVASRTDAVNNPQG